MSAPVTAERPKLYTIDEAAELLTLTPSMVSRLIREKQIEALITSGSRRAPRGYRFTLAQIEAYIASRPTTTAAPEGGAR